MSLGPEEAAKDAVRMPKLGTLTTNSIVATFYHIWLITFHHPTADIRTLPKGWMTAAEAVVEEAASSHQSMIVHIFDVFCLRTQVSFGIRKILKPSVLEIKPSLF